MQNYQWVINYIFSTLRSIYILIKIVMYIYPVRVYIGVKLLCQNQHDNFVENVECQYICLRAVKLHTCNITKQSDTYIMCYSMQALQLAL